MLNSKQIFIFFLTLILSLNYYAQKQNSIIVSSEFSYPNINWTIKTIDLNSLMSLLIFYDPGNDTTFQSGRPFEIIIKKNEKNKRPNEINFYVGSDINQSKGLTFMFESRTKEKVIFSVPFATCDEEVCWIKEENFGYTLTNKNKKIDLINHFINNDIVIIEFTFKSGKVQTIKIPLDNFETNYLKI